MRLAYLIGTYPAVSHTFIAREVNALRQRGAEVHTLSVHKPDDAQLLTAEDRAEASATASIQPPNAGVVLAAHLSAFLSDPGRYIATLRLALSFSSGGLRSTLWHAFYFAEAIVLRRMMRQRRVKHVHVHFANAASMIALLCAHFMRPHGWTWSFTMHGPTEFDDVTRYRLAEKVERAAFVACISDYARSQLMKLTDPERWGRLRIVHCGVDLELFSPVPRADDGPTEILCVGRLVPEKGQEILLQAVAQLVQEGHDIGITYVGDGPQRGSLEESARALGVDDRAVFTGSVGQDRIRDLYARSDIFCLASFAEGVPVVLMEAMAMELPAVSTRIMGIPELIVDGVTGRLVAPGRVDDLADVLRDLATDIGERRRLGEAGRAKVAADYDIAIAAKDLHAVLGEFPAVAGR